MQKWIALLGRPDAPTDGVADYCGCLGKTLLGHGIELKSVYVRWDASGWNSALRTLARQSEEWRGAWVFLQYTALAWSRRGFPFGALRAMRILKRNGARVAVVFHEFLHQPGPPSLVRAIRAASQDFVIRRLYAQGSACIFTVPTRKVPWLKHDQAKAVSIPIGANIPEPSEDVLYSERNGQNEKTVAVFCFSPGPERQLEIGDVVHAVKACHSQGVSVRLVLLGRGSEEVRSEAEAALAGTGIGLRVFGMVSAEAASKELAQADALLFVRGPVAQMRGTALAGIACGLPVVGYEGAAEGTEIASAGLHLAPYRDRELLAAALCRVLSNGDLWSDLRRRSLNAQHTSFSWSTIAKRYVEVCAPEAMADASLPEIQNSSVHSPRTS